MLWMLGGDTRSYWAAQALRKNGYTLQTHDVPPLPNAPLPERFSRLILPFPSFQGERVRGSIPIAELLSRLDSSSRVYGALFGAWKEKAEALGAQIIDLYGSEPLTTANAVPTAEGAIALAIEHSPITLHGSHCLVIGAGRIGKILAQKLYALGAEVTLTSRRVAERALGEGLGLHSDITGVYTRGLSRYDFLFNTVPETVLTQQQLQELSPECLLIELASKPGGYSEEICAQLGLQSIFAPGLPGKFSPKTAGALYAQSIMEREESA